MKKLLLTAAVPLLVLATATASAADLKRGKQLHDENCINCHVSLVGGDGSGIYTRPDRRIDSKPALVNQVNRCQDSMSMPWPEDQINDVVHYLNSRFYKFE